MDILGEPGPLYSIDPYLNYLYKYHFFLCHEIGRTKIIDILDQIIQGGHAVNKYSVQKYHGDLYKQLLESNSLEILEPLQLFITNWSVQNAYNRLVLPLVPGEPYHFSVKWGDGSGEEKIHLLRGWNNADENKSNTGTHVYPAPGVYTVTITGTIRGFHRTGARGYKESLCVYNPKKARGMLVCVKQWGLVQLTSCQNMFRENRTADLIESLNAPDLHSCTNMTCMFADNQYFNGDLSKWDVSNVKNMTGMFYLCPSFNRALWRGELVANVTNMNSIFYECSKFNQNIGDWDVAKVTNMKKMFYGCSQFNQDIGNWNVSKVTNTKKMFSHCGLFNQPIGGWDVSTVMDMRYMFNACESFNQPLWWDVSSVTHMSGMFAECVLFNKPIGGWEVHAEDMSNMFIRCTAFNQYIDEMRR
jgi:surface protein